MAKLVIEISDDVLSRSGSSEKELRIEFACRMFDAEKIGKHEACCICGLTRDEFNEELVLRGLPVIRYTAEMWRQDYAFAMRGHDQP